MSSLLFERFIIIIIITITTTTAAATAAAATTTTTTTTTIGICYYYYHYYWNLILLLLLLLEVVITTTTTTGILAPQSTAVLFRFLLMKRTERLAQGVMYTDATRSLLTSPRLSRHARGPLTERQRGQGGVRATGT